MPEVLRQGDWFKQYYGELYQESVRDLLTPERTAREVDFLCQATGMGPASAVADLGSGEGRHAIELARRGHRVTAVELNAEFVARARSAAGEESTIRFVEGDMRRVVPGPYDLVTILSHTFGFFTHAQNTQLLEDWSRELAPHGHLVIDVWNRERMLRRFEKSLIRRVSPTLTVAEECTWDAQSERLHVRYTYLHSPGGAAVREASFRLYSLDQLREMISLCGIKVSGVFGSLEGEPYGDDAPRMVIVAERMESGSQTPLEI